MTARCPRAPAYRDRGTCSRDASRRCRTCSRRQDRRWQTPTRRRRGYPREMRPRLRPPQSRPSTPAAANPIAPERIPTTMPPPRLWTPIRPGPAIRNTGISTISRSRIIPAGPDAHHHTQNADTSTATATSTRPAVSSESEPNAVAATRLYVQIAIRLPVAVTIRSRRTSFRRRSGSIATVSIVTLLGNRAWAARQGPPTPWISSRPTVDRGLRDLGQRLGRGARLVLGQDAHLVLLVAVVQDQ